VSQPTGEIISGLIKSEEPMSNEVTRVTYYDPESSPPQKVREELRVTLWERE
jgi:hypothetical protein